MLVLYLSNRHIRVLDGSAKGNKFVLNRLLHTLVPESSIINGVVIDEEAFSAHLSAFWAENKLPSDKVLLVVNTNKIITKLVEVPSLKINQTLEYLPKEFLELESVQRSVYTYWTLSESKETKRRKVLASMAEYELLDSYVQLFAGMGIKIGGISTALASAIKILTKSTEFKGKTCLVQLFDENSLGNFLFVDGEYYYSEWPRLFSEKGTRDFGFEVGRSVGKIIQFAKAQQIESEITEVYLGGLEPQDLEFCREGIGQTNAALEVKALTQGINWVNRDLTASLGESLILLGALLETDTHENLFLQYKSDQKKNKERNEYLKLAIPAIALTGVFLLITLVLAGLHFFEVIKLNNLNDFNQRTDVLAMKEEYDQLTVETTQLNQEYNATRSTLDNINSYPTINSNVEKVLESCAVGLAQIEVVSFDANSGIIFMNTYAREVDLINRYIRVLSQETLFQKVNYTGYNWLDAQSCWKINVVCYLSPAAGRNLDEGGEDSGQLENGTNPPG